MYFSPVVSDCVERVINVDLYHHITKKNSLILSGVQVPQLHLTEVIWFITVL